MKIGNIQVINYQHAASELACDILTQGIHQAEGSYMENKVKKGEKMFRAPEIIARRFPGL